MLDPRYILLHVDNPAASAAFYAAQLDRQPVELSPTFALFVLDSGVKLGLWSRHTVEPAASALPGAAELGFPLAEPHQVDAQHTRWQAQGLTIVQPPCDLDFGRSCVALDPDGHRLRAFALTL